MSSVNFNSVNECRDAYVNYYYGNNTKGITESDIKEIETRYKSQLSGWKIEAENDQNVYDIEDDSSRSASNRSGGDLMGAAATSVGGVVATHAANTAAINGITNAGGVFLNGTPNASAMGSQVFAEVGVDGSASTTTQMASKANNTSAIGFIVECTLGLATGVLYQTSKPNKDEHEELMDLEGQMQEYLSNLDEAEGLMAADTDIVEEIAEEAETVSEETEKSLEELQAEYEEKLARQQELQDKIDAGETLTEEESSEYDQLGVDLAELSEKISEQLDDSTEEIDGISEEADPVLDDLESTADTVEDIQSTADYAENFDKDTQKMCIVESVAQGLNVASSTKGAISAFKFAQSGAALFGSTLWANAFGAMGISGATMSALGVAEQIKMAADIGGEIDIRKEVQNLNTEVADIQEETSEVLNETIDDIDEVRSDVEDVDVPEPEPEPEPLDVPEDDDEKPDEKPAG